MSIRPNTFLSSVVLAAAVANTATVTFAYPAGTSQLSFNAGLAGSAHYVMLNNNDRWGIGSPGIAISFGAGNITVTNNSGYSWPAGTKVDLNIDSKRGRSRIPHTLQLPLLVDIANGDILTEARPGIEGFLEYVEFITTKPVTTAAKLATLNLEIDTTDVTGGTIALTSATVTPMGKVIAGSDITGNNRLYRESKLSIEASGVTAFVEGSGYLILYIRPIEDDAY